MSSEPAKKRKRCPSCRCLFRPTPRAGDRQRFCTKPGCQRERHRRACQRWHAKNPGYNRDERLRKKVAPVPKSKPPATLDTDPIVQLDLRSMRPEVGGGVVVMVEEVCRVTREWTRDAVRKEVRGPRGPPP